MGLVSSLRGAKDVVVLASTSKSAEKQDDDGSKYDKLALKLTDQVMKGTCDPLAAEAALSDYKDSETTGFVDTAKGERGAKALERLVVLGALDPIFAENVLDRGFSRWSVDDALEHLDVTKE
jgi:uncharacterized protein (DUF2342 family)